jgi:hypothetical protein
MEKTNPIGTKVTFALEMFIGFVFFYLLIQLYHCAIEVEATTKQLSISCPSIKNKIVN